VSKNFPAVNVGENLPLIYSENCINFVFLGIDGITGWKCKGSNYYEQCGKLIGELHSLLDDKYKKNEYKALTQKVQSHDFNDLLTEIRKELDKKETEINYGLVHSDLHSGNILLSNGDYYIIDFGSLNYGYRVTDLLNLAYEIHYDGVRAVIRIREILCVNCVKRNTTL